MAYNTQHHFSIVGCCLICFAIWSVGCRCIDGVDVDYSDYTILSPIDNTSDHHYPQWEITIDRNDVSIDVVAGPPRNDPFFYTLTDNRVLLRYSDEDEDRVIWRYTDYEIVAELAVTTDDRYLLIQTWLTTPWLWTSQSTQIYVYDLMERELVTVKKHVKDEDRLSSGG